MARVDTIRIALTFADDTIGLMSFTTAEYASDGSVRWEVAPTEFAIDAVIAQLEGRNEPNPENIALPPEKRPVKSWRIIREDAIPPRDEFRNALRDNGREIVHDMEHCRAIQLEKLRRDRAPLLDSLDRDWMKATGQGDSKAAEAVEAKRQALRDAPDAVAAELAAASTVEELKAIKLPE